uniref:Uncharacterized protein n=1 Tax=Ignisphaera aggregans TaxID=334771 RepID=A0A7C5YRV6_9CREN
MPFANLCLSRKESLVKIEIFNEEGKSINEYEYKDVDLVEVKGSIRIDYTTFSLPKNMICIFIEFNGDVKLIEKVLKVG